MVRTLKALTSQMTASKTWSIYVFHLITSVQHLYSTPKPFSKILVLNLPQRWLLHERIMNVDSKESFCSYCTVYIDKFCSVHFAIDCLKCLIFYVLRIITNCLQVQ